MSRDWREGDHPRRPAGDEHGGEFVQTPGGGWVSTLVRRLRGGEHDDFGSRRALLEHYVTTERNPALAEQHGGMVAATRLATFADGHQAIRKSYPEQPQKATIEHLASQVGGLLGAPVMPTAMDPDLPQVVWMEYAAGGKIGVESGPHVNTEAGFRLGLFDALIANGDRNNGNWKLMDDGSIAGFDHGEAFGGIGHYRGNDAFLSPNVPRVTAFQRLFVGINAEDQLAQWRLNDLHPDDVPVIRARLETLRSQFVEADLRLAFDRMLLRLKAIGIHARGTTRRYQ
jgi:hypothetical protein